MEQSVEFLIKSHYAQLVLQKRKMQNGCFTGISSNRRIPWRVFRARWYPEQSHDGRNAQEYCRSDLKETVRLISNAEECIFSVWKFGGDRSGSDDKAVISGIDCQYYTDYYLQRISASSLHQDDTVIAISYSGQSKDVVDTVKIAKKAGAKVVVITNFGQTLLEKWGDVVLKSSQKQLLYGDASFQGPRRWH